MSVFSAPWKQGYAPDTDLNPDPYLGSMRPWGPQNAYIQNTQGSKLVKTLGLRTSWQGEAGTWDHPPRAQTRTGGPRSDECRKIPNPKGNTCFGPALQHRAAFPLSPFHLASQDQDPEPRSPSHPRRKGGGPPGSSWRSGGCTGTCLAWDFLLLLLSWPGRGGGEASCAGARGGPWCGPAEAQAQAGQAPQAGGRGAGPAAVGV